MEMGGVRIVTVEEVERIHHVVLVAEETEDALLLLRIDTREALL